MISERAKALLDGSEESAEVLAAIRGLERLALSRTVEVASNGRFPKWGFDRWWRVGVGAIAVAGWIWLASARWATVEGAAAEMASVKAAISGVRDDLAVIRGEVKANRELSDQRSDQLSAQLADVATEARNAARNAASAAWSSSGRGRGGRPQ